MIDSHAHLDDPQADPIDILAQLTRLRGSGWSGAVVAGYGPERFARGRALCAGQPLLRRAVGLHPEWLAACVSDQARQQAWQDLQAESRHDTIVAIGEVGVDKRFREKMPAIAQQMWLARGLLLAAQRRLPVVLHVVGWHGHALEVLRQGPLPNGGVVHRFSGSPDMVPQYEALGLHIGVCLEPREDPVRRAALVRAIHPERIVIETDWPLHELSYADCYAKLMELAAQVAVWRGADLPGLLVQLARNTRMLYRLDSPHDRGPKAAE